jgi:hypothetical protein
MHACMLGKECVSKDKTSYDVSNLVCYNINGKLIGSN